jgi:hypothetical protein
MAEGIVIPISTPGGEESAAVLDRIADKLEEVGGAADKSATKMGASATSSSAAIGRIAAATEGTKTAVERLGESGNRGLHALSEKASELAGSMGGAAGKIADVGIKSLAAFGGIGLQATAAVGAVLMLYNAYQQYEAQQRAVTAGATTLAAVNAQLGGSYDSVRMAAAQDGTAEERVNAIRAAGLAILQQRIALDQQGYNSTEVVAFTGSLDMLMQAYVGLGAAAPLATREMVQHALQSGNAAEQQRLLGTSFQHSTDATIEHANQTRALTIVSARASEASLTQRTATLRAAEAAVAAARANVAAVASAGRLAYEDGSVTAAAQQLAAAQGALATITRQVGSATASNTRLQQDATTAALELAAANAQVQRVAEEAILKQQANEAKSRGAQSRHTSGGASVPSAEDLASQAEGLRMARVANDNAMHGSSIEQRVEQARAHLAVTTTALAEAESSRHHHARRVTSALQEQTQAQEAYRTAIDAEIDQARVRVAAVDASETARLALANAQRDAQYAAEASLTTGAAQLRQAEARSLAMRRASDDAAAANAAENALSPSGVSPRAALLAAEETATRELARATVDLATARREEADASIPSEERTARMTTALSAQTGALQRQRAAQRAVTAEVDKIKTDRTDALAASAKGLGDGLVSAGLAAAFAGENIGAALQKQLAASLQALAIESAQKALFALAQGFYFLAIPGGQASAAASFTSAAIFGAVAVGAGAVSAAIAPSAAPATAGGGADERASSVSPGGAGGMGGGSGAGPIVNNYYAPIVGGRQSTDAETGVRIDRYNDAARARLRRAA